MDRQWINGSKQRCLVISVEFVWQWALFQCNEAEETKCSNKHQWWLSACALNVIRLAQFEDFLSPQNQTTEKKLNFLSTLSRSQLNLVYRLKSQFVCILFFNVKPIKQTKSGCRMKSNQMQWKRDNRIQIQDWIFD